MTLKMLFDVCSMICDKHISKNLNACVSYNDEQVRYTELKEELEKVRDWCYNMNTTNLRQCIQCKDCAHYRVTGTVTKGKQQITSSCELDNQYKSPEHYCGFAKER